MNTRSRIILLGDALIRRKGYNAFSFGDISNELNIKKASIHYHFSTKTALVNAIIQKHIELLEKFIKRVADAPPLDKINLFLLVYSMAKSEGRISILGSLGNDYYTLREDTQKNIKSLTDRTLDWLAHTLREGKNLGVFHYTMDDRSKALMVITNILGAEQLSRITNQSDFQKIKQNIINDLIQ